MTCAWGEGREGGVVTCAQGGGRCCDLCPGGERGVVTCARGGREGGRCCDLCPGGRWLTFGVAHLPPPPGVEVSHACEIIAFARFATRAVIKSHK